VKTGSDPHESDPDPHEVIRIRMKVIRIRMKGIRIRMEAGLAIKNPPKKTHPKKQKKIHQKKPTKNVFFLGFFGFLNF
jgi:hypothetical protein